MTTASLLQVIVYFLTLLALVKPLGWYIAAIHQDTIPAAARWLSPIEKMIYSFCAIDKSKEMTWKSYLTALLLFSICGILLIYLLQRIQFWLPLNPQHFSNIPPLLAFNTATSFTTNTNWQAYSGETTMSYLTQMLAFTVQNFLSAATGLSLLLALIRGLIRHEQATLGNFWVDIVRSIVYILLPLSCILALALAATGVIQSLQSSRSVQLLQQQRYVAQAIQPPKASSSLLLATQTIPLGPVASQIAIKQLGTNGGGFFNTSSAHPLENPTPLSNFLEMLAILLIPAASCYTFGLLVGDKRQGWAILATMLAILIPLTFATIYYEQQGNPLLQPLGIDTAAHGDLSPGGNMEGKETRFGITNSALWATLTTATANGSVNAMHDSFMPLGGLIPLWLMQLGEVIFGGVGSGLYSMLMLIILTVFIGGLMVGRTPEYLGKRIEPHEMKMAVIAVLIMPIFVLFFTAIAVTTSMGTSAIGNPHAHGFTEVLYAFTSMLNNNGSAFSGLNANTPFYNLVGGFGMLIGRFWIAIPVLAVAGALVQKKTLPLSAGTLPTHTPLFVMLLIGMILILGALTFFPALALGPIVEHLQLWSQHGN